MGSALHPTRHTLALRQPSELRRSIAGCWAAGLVVDPQVDW